MLALGQSKHQAKFLSTLSLRRATSFDFCIICLPSYFYPRSPCGERRRNTPDDFCSRGISIHALLAESDQRSQPQSRCHCDFYPRSPCGERLKQLFATIGTTIFLSTLSLRRATLRAMAAAQDNAISIHALLAESDISSSGVSAGRMHFYPRSPCGERRRNGCHGFYSCLFLSTLSLRRATLP